MNKKIPSVFAPFFATLFVVCSFSANAIVITSGCASSTACTLSELSSGATLSVDGVLFDNWNFAQSEDPNLLVTGVQGNASNGGPGLDFSFSINFTSTPVVDLDFSYNVSGAGLSASHLSGISYFIPPGDAGEFIAVKQLFDSGAGLIGTSCLDNNSTLEWNLNTIEGITCDNSPNLDVSSTMFDLGAQPSLSVRGVLFGDGWLDGVTVQSFSHNFTLVPEPHIAILFLTGSLFLFIRKSKR